LGRCLDALYDAGVSGLYQQIAEKVVGHLKLTCEFTHLDSTSFHYDGKANSVEDAPTAIHITKGYSRDHRPQLNQVVLNLICENLSGIPVYMQAQSGNINEVESIILGGYVNTSADKASKIWLKSHEDIIAMSDSEILKHDIFKQSGRPKLNQEPDSYEYQITGQLYCVLANRQQRLQEKGMFMLATNDLSDTLTMEKMLSLYKSQQSVEKGFRFLKSPDFLTSSLYLKKPERIEALLMVMTCCLMVYAALEHKIRRELKAQSVYFPNLKYKPCQNPTARWVFFCFQGFHVLTISEEQQLVLNIEDRHKIIIKSMGSIYQQIYS
jgi:transposase